jgi:hypothetical protein
MIIPTLILLSAQGAKAPVIPPGLNKEFVSVCYAIENDLATGDFDGAQKLSDLLPKAQATVHYDDSGVSFSRRATFHGELNNVIDQVKPLTTLVETSGKADIDISFAKRVDPDPNAPIPRAAEVSFGLEQPRVSTRIALDRTANPTPVTQNNVHNEIAFAVAEYLGLEQRPGFGTFSSRSDEPTILSVGFDPDDQQLAKLALDVSDQLRTLIADKQKVAPAAPVLDISETEVDGVKGIQDLPLDIHGLKVTNKGNADLLMYVLPDCSCLRPSYQTVLKPGESARILASVNTAVYHTGHMEHSLLVYSNDPVRPMITIPVKMYVEPLFRFAKSGSDVVPLTEKGADFDIYLAIVDQLNVHVLTASLIGVRGTVQMEPWKGVLPDDTDSQGQTSKGYKFHIHVDPNGRYGQVRGSMMLGTDSESFREQNYDFTLQNGVVAEPSQLYFGTVPPEPRSFYFLVTDPSKSFNITAIDSDNPSFKFKSVPKGDHEYRINVDFDGHVEFGAFAATITIHTDNPKQPVIRVPVSGKVQ